MLPWHRRLPCCPVPPRRPGTPLAPLASDGQSVPLVQGGSVRWVNLDYAASAPALRAVADHVAQVLPLYASVHRGAGYASEACTAAYEAARRQVAAFVGARPDDVAVFTRNTTDALNLLATAVPGDGRVTWTSSITPTCCPGRRAATGWCPPGPRWPRRSPRSRRNWPAARRPCSPSPARPTSPANACPSTSSPRSRTGTAPGSRSTGRSWCRTAGSTCAAIGADYLALSGHKMYAPFGAGALIGRRDWLDAAPAYLAGGGAVREVTCDSVRWAPAPARHEAGTPDRAWRARPGRGVP